MVEQEDKGQGLLVPSPVLSLGEGTRGQMSCPVLLSSLIRYRRALDMRREIKTENAAQAKMQGTSMRFAQCPADASVAPMRAPPMTVAVVGQSRAAGAAKFMGELPADRAHLKERPAPTRPVTLGAPPTLPTSTPLAKHAPA